MKLDSVTEYTFRKVIESFFDMKFPIDLSADQAG